MPEVCLRRWRLEDVEDIAVMVEDEQDFASDAVRCGAVNLSDHPAGELSYWLVPDARGRGLAYAAVQTMLRSVVPATGLRTVVLDIEDDNVASLRLAERLGAERRHPARVKRDRGGTPRTLLVHVLAVH